PAPSALARPTFSSNKKPERKRPTNMLLRALMNSHPIKAGEKSSKLFVGDVTRPIFSSNTKPRSTSGNAGFG
ncbi:MAG: hypothetical protein RMJ57_08245, partial [Bacteroidia bacterium]|nr:hypothetical protein [Bacteroidia bacterium]